MGSQGNKRVRIETNFLSVKRENPTHFKNSTLTLSLKRGILAQARISQCQPAPNAISRPGETSLAQARILQYSLGFHPPRSYLAPRTFWRLQVDDIHTIKRTKPPFVCVSTRGNTGHLHPINPEIDRTYHRTQTENRIVNRLNPFGFLDHNSILGSNISKSNSQCSFVESRLTKRRPTHS
ncbi:hypothetical protein Lal_00015793 [Lupinus albus]|nr:hypothetical protein Lal_00015793 [Lupinus albus]